MSYLATIMSEETPTAKQRMEPVQEANAKEATTTAADNLQEQEETHVPEKRGHDEATSEAGESASHGDGAKTGHFAGSENWGATENSTDLPPKRPKREWLSFHGIKHTRVGAEFQVTSLPTVEPKASHEDSTENSGENKD